MQKANAEYQTKTIMPLARADGCKCHYTQKAYLEGKFTHHKDCPAAYVENLPNAGKLMEALRGVYTI